MNGKEKIKIIIDSQEPPIWDKRFKREGFEVIRERLLIGDFLLPDKGIVIERKSWGDLFGSIINGHLQKQLIQQQDSYKHSYLIITGCMKEYIRYSRQRYITKPYVTGFLAHLRHYPNITIIPCEQDTFMPLVIKKLYLKASENIDITNTELLKSSMTVEHLNLRVLMSYEGLGIKKSIKALKSAEIKAKIEELTALLLELGIIKKIN